MSANPGQRLALWRKNKGLSQRALGSAMDVSQGYIGDIEGGRCEPSRNFLIRLQERFGLRADYILYGAGDPVAPETPPPRTRADDMVLMISGVEVGKVYAEFGLNLSKDALWKEGTWFCNELVARMKYPDDGDELEALLPEVRELLRTRLHNRKRS
nr:helix-turn-helix transcriptional regulator [uncultured Roseovarius sp.]